MTKDTQSSNVYSMNMITPASNDVVHIVDVPKVGQHVWFIVPAEDELWAGMALDGEIIRVDLNTFEISVHISENNPDMRWTLPINGEGCPFYTSELEFLNALLEERTKELRAYQRKFGPLN